jgi:hypothetical protein
MALSLTWSSSLVDGPFISFDHGFCRLVFTVIYHRTGEVRVSDYFWPCLLGWVRVDEWFIDCKAQLPSHDNHHWY